MSSFKFVFLSKDESFRIPAAEVETFKAQGAEFVYVANNARPMGEVYNENMTGDFDYYVFMHADVKLDLGGLMRHVESVAGKYDLIGLCGCQNLQVSQSPLNWFCGSRPFPEKRWGCVVHGELGNQTTFFNQDRKEITDHEVACIDGLCIILTRKAVDAGLRFDPSVGNFNCYDTDISLQAVLTYKLKVGVVVRMDLQHYSVGRSILGDEFLRNELALRKKWNFDIPAGSRLEKMVTETGKTA